MRKFMMPALAAVLLGFAPHALQAQHKPGDAQQQRTQDKKPQQQQPKKKSAPSSNGPYGEWKSAWGKAPPAPPKHWTKKSDWHRHVRACQQRYKSYSPGSDAYRTYSGKQIRCKL